MKLENIADAADFIDHNSTFIRELKNILNKKPYTKIRELITFLKIIYMYSPSVSHEISNPINIPNLFIDSNFTNNIIRYDSLYIYIGIDKEMIYEILFNGRGNLALQKLINNNKLFYILLSISNIHNIDARYNVFENTIHAMYNIINKTPYIDYNMRKLYAWIEESHNMELYNKIILHIIDKRTSVNDIKLFFDNYIKTISNNRSFFYKYLKYKQKYDDLK
jgi:hypothetical protein